MDWQLQVLLTCLVIAIAVGSVIARFVANGFSLVDILITMVMAVAVMAALFARIERQHEKHDHSDEIDKGKKK